MEAELKLLLEVESSTGNGSQKIKQDLIKNNYTPIMDYLLKIALNPFLTTKLSHIEILPEQPYIVDYDPYEKFQDLTKRLLESPAANNKLREEAFELINCTSYDFNTRKMLLKVLTKSLNIGIGAKLINKGIGKQIIPDPSLMLAQDDESEINKWSKIICEEKYDGVRIIAVVDGEEVKFFTRQFNEISRHYLSEIADSCLSLIKKSGLKGSWFFDGELTDTNRKSVSGKVTKMLKGSPSDQIGDDLLFNIFDLEETSVLQDGKGFIPFEIRRDTLEGVFEENTSTSLVLAESFLAKEKEDIYTYYKSIIAKGGEGVILKNPEHVYECKRSKNWIKLKEVNDCDLVITGWYPGEGKREGLIGGFICEDQSGKIKVRVGSGFSDEDLKEISKDPDSYISRICAVQYNVIISDKNDNWSLFLPRLVEVRSDKDSADDMQPLCK
jgi:DNA ligase-1